MRRKVVHPDLVLEQLVRPSTPYTEEQLRRVHAVLTAYTADGGVDFRGPTLEALAEKNNLPPLRLAGSRKPYFTLMKAHREYCNAIEVPDHAHPNATLDALLQKGTRPDNQFNLRQLSDFCERQFRAGARAFNRPALAKAWMEEHGERPYFLDYHDHGFTDVIEAWHIYANPTLAGREKRRRKQVSSDIDLSWASVDYPLLEEWTKLIAAWMKELPTGLSAAIAAVRKFYGSYLSLLPTPESPAQLLSRKRNPPPFEPAGISAKTRKLYLSNISDLTDWILRNHLSIENDDGILVPAPAFWNPFADAVKRSPRATTPSETVLSPLPFVYVQELREMLCEGPDFAHWQFARSALGAKKGELGRPGGDWFEVPKSLIDEKDPDCVFRSTKVNGVMVYEMWEPVRWVTLLIKLQTPLRTMQTRLLDSGESDTWKFTGDGWELNDHPLALGSAHKLVAQGVFYKPKPGDGDDLCSLYINTNKTADDQEMGEAKGFVEAWPHFDDISQNPYYWLRKLRNWQSKYNPVDRCIHWSELDQRHIPAKSAAQLARYSPACFLFRCPTNPDSPHLPISNSRVDGGWNALLYRFEQRLAERGETYSDGSAVQLTKLNAAGYADALFPLHCLRVSLISALHHEGGVEAHLLAKAAGHSRLTSTLYYSKATYGYQRRRLQEGFERLQTQRRAQTEDFLLTEQVEHLVREAISNDPAALRIALPENPADRRRSGWMHMHHGVCLMGGNTEQLVTEPKVGGCHNGGPPIRPKSIIHGPVPGGPRNCVRCRWFVTAGRYLQEMVDQLNIYAYHHGQAQDKAIKCEREWAELNAKKAELEATGQPFLQAAELATKQRAREAAMAKFVGYAQDMNACLRLAERCRRALQVQQPGTQTLITNDSPDEIRLVIERDASELRQLSGVCDALEFCSEYDAPAAVLRHTQLLDAALAREGHPPFFVALSPDEQLLVGNAVMRRLASVANPDDEGHGKRKVIQLIDARQRLGETLGVSLGDAVEAVAHDAAAGLLPGIAMPLEAQ